MNQHEKEIADRLEAIPIDQARIQIASGHFGERGTPDHRFASDLLSAKEAELRDERDTKTLSLAKGASAVALDANRIASETFPLHGAQHGKTELSQLLRC
ncbi:MAG: hypothetical protein ABSC55_00330 [Syntrophorhabdales bacterium]|jgi:hypothetical protein